MAPVPLPVVPVGFHDARSIPVPTAPITLRSSPASLMRRLTHGSHDADDHAEVCIWGQVCKSAPLCVQFLHSGVAPASKDDRAQVVHDRSRRDVARRAI